MRYLGTHSEDAISEMAAVMRAQLEQQSKRQRRHYTPQQPLNPSDSDTPAPRKFLDQCLRQYMKCTGNCSDTLNLAPYGTQALYFPVELQDHKQHSKNTPAQNGLDQGVLPLQSE